MTQCKVGIPNGLDVCCVRRTSGQRTLVDAIRLFIMPYVSTYAVQNHFADLPAPILELVCPRIPRFLRSCTALFFVRGHPLVVYVDHELAVPNVGTGEVAGIGELFCSRIKSLDAAPA